MSFGAVHNPVDKFKFSLKVRRYLLGRTSGLAPIIPTA